jgi:hypothetical protein
VVGGAGIRVRSAILQGIISAFAVTIAPETTAFQLFTATIELGTSKLTLFAPLPTIDCTETVPEVTVGNVG